MERPTLSGYWVLVILITSIALWAFMVFGTLAHLRQLAGGLDPFDVRPFGYGISQARGVLEMLGTDGREFYLKVQLRLDTVYLATYAISRGLVVWWLTGLGRLRDTPISIPLRLLMVAPSIATAALDYAENAMIQKMLLTGPSVEASIIETASRLTRLKSLVSAINEVSVILLAVIAARRWQRRRES